MKVVPITDLVQNSIAMGNRVELVNTATYNSHEHLVIASGVNTHMHAHMLTCWAKKFQEANTMLCVNLSLGL